MARTGYLITVYQDINPSSPTYNQTREERTKDETKCPTSATANWVEDTRYCELTNNGMQTGYEIIVYRDVEPLSPTYNQTRQERVLNTAECEADDATPDWQNIGETFCRQVVYMPGGMMANDGYMIQQQQDMNEYSATADQIRDVATLDYEHCPKPNTNPVYNILSETCQTVIVDGVQKRTGKKEVVRIDTNVYSPTYNFGNPETVLVNDSINCPSDFDAVYRLYSQNGSNFMRVPIDGGTISLIPYVSTKNGDYYDDLTFITSEESWIQPTGEVSNLWGNVALIQATLESIPDRDKDEGRSTTVVVKQKGGLTTNLTIEQRISQTKVNMMFNIVNNTTTSLSFNSITINLENGRTFSFSPGSSPISAGSSRTYTATVSNYFVDKQLAPNQPVQASINVGQSVKPVFLSIDATSLESGGRYSILCSE